MNLLLIMYFVTLQDTIQAIVSTDGISASFAIFNYGNDISSAHLVDFPFQIIFHTGDGIRLREVPPGSLQTTNNLFRIDGIDGDVVATLILAQ